MRERETPSIFVEVGLTCGGISTKWENERRVLRMSGYSHNLRGIGEAKAP